MDEEIAGAPFVGTSGQELKRQLKEAGIDLEDCYITNVIKYRPPGNDVSEWLTDKKTALKRGFELIKGRYCHPFVKEGLEELGDEIANVRPDVIIGLGNVALWAMTGNWGITNWRGSELQGTYNIPFVPTLHPASVLRNWATRPQVIHDLKFRVKRRLDSGFVTPHYDFNTAPTFLETIELIESLQGDVAFDVETAGGHITCLGIANSPTKAVCIPFRDNGGVYWHQDDQKDILETLRRKLESGEVCLVGQNWNYDAQYFDEDFGWTRMADFDTYIAQSVLFPGSERGLGYLSSIYCDHHVYWKEDAKDWGKVADFQSLFRYNCLDVCRDWEIAQQQRLAIIKSGLLRQFEERMAYSRTVYRMMRRGVIRDPQRTQKILSEIEEAIHERELLVAEGAGHPVNFASPKQVGTLLFKEMGLKPVGRATSKGAPSTSDEALTKLVEKHPNAAEICTAILEARSLSSIRANFLEAEADPDGNFRSSWMATGTETFRCTSGGNAFHRGGPLQNITDGKHTHSGRRLPNLRSTIVPPPGWGIYSCDLERADLQVVAWEAEDDELKTALREHLDIHLLNAQTIFNLPFSFDDLRDPKIVKELAEKFEQKRHFAKTFVHGTNYGGKARTMAINAKCTVFESEQAQSRWFKAHPGIKEWHERVEANLLGTRTVTNKFGYRRIYFDRVDGLLPEALAWVPQSTVSILISLIQMTIEQELGEDAPIILQGHDSIVGYYRLDQEHLVLPRIKLASHIPVPYLDPLYIPLDLATSSDSWGLVEKREWPLG